MSVWSLGFVIPASWLQSHCIELVSVMAMAILVSLVMKTAVSPKHYPSSLWSKFGIIALHLAILNASKCIITQVI